MREDLAFGIHGLLRREPFEDRWGRGEYGTWEFALAQERYVLSMFAAKLFRDEQEFPAPEWDWLRTALVAAVREVSADLIVVKGSLDPSLRARIAIETDTGWEQGGWRTGLASTIWLLGAIERAPILWAVREGPFSASALQMGEWGQIRRYCPAREGELVQADVTPRDSDVEVQYYEALEIVVTDSTAAVPVRSS